MSKVDPKWKLSTSIKLEPMPAGKAPRFLIADGDQGQIMALLVIKCMEECMFSKFPSKCVKHCGRKEGAAKLIKELDGLHTVEGDGSAWDTTCNNTVRKLFESPVLEKIGNIAKKYCVVPDTWIEAHQQICESEKLSIWFNGKDKTDRKKFTILGQRRSGHAGTSCLNWWVNFSMWACSTLRDPWTILDEKTNTAMTIEGERIFIKIICEGDDSLAGMSINLLASTREELCSKILSFWERAGFDMKFVFPRFGGATLPKGLKATTSERATFCGLHFAVDQEGKLTGAFCPEIPRAFTNGSVTVSPQAREGFVLGNVYRIKQVARAASLARAYDFAGICPTISTKYLRYSQSLQVNTIAENTEAQELMWKMHGREAPRKQLVISELEEKINELNAGTPDGYSTDLALYQSLGFNVTLDELEAFVAYEWDWDRLDDFNGLCMSLPAAFR
jgi:hypothetical protein